MGEMNDAYTGNDDVGSATQTGFLDFWAIATAQSVMYKQPYTMSNLYAAETGLIQAGALAEGYIENSTVTVALSGVRCELMTPAVLTYDLASGGSIEIDIEKMTMTTDSAFLTGTHVKANDTLQSEELISHCEAFMSKADEAMTGIESGAFCSTLGEALRI